MSIKSKLQALRSGVSFFGLVVAFSSQYYPAHAGAGTITVKDSTGATQTFDVVTDGSGNFIQKSVTCDQSAAANCASVDASHNLGVVVGEALPGGTATLGVVNVLAITNALPGGTNTIGAVSAIVASLPGGTATLGTVNAILGGGTATLGAVSAIVGALPAGTNKLGTVDPATIATWGLASVNPGTAPTNAAIGGVVYSSTAPTLTTGQSVALQSDSSGNLKVNVAVGNFSLAGASSILVWGGGTLATTSAYGSAPSGQVPGVNAFITNANNNGQATMGASSPVVIASDQSAVLIKNLDPCTTKLQKSINLSQSATAAKIFSGTTLTSNYICSLFFTDDTAERVSVVEGASGATCGSSTFALIANAAASLGAPFAANGGVAWAGGGFHLAAGTNAGFDVCIFKSGGGTLGGALSYVQS